MNFNFQKSIGNVVRGAVMLLICVILFQTPFDFELIPEASQASVKFASSMANHPKKAAKTLEILFGVFGGLMGLYLLSKIGKQ